MTERPLWWRVGKGKWHEEWESSGLFVQDVLDGVLNAVANCGLWFDLSKKANVEHRRTAPPVADQCKRCRAAKKKAKERKV